ncbi:hypothetical protein J3A78_003844 [Streptomyces sp. PvR006]|nr:hypothetical protein [Streptomyces sp. PvR006]
MRPACLDDPDVQCGWDDGAGACPCDAPDQPDPEPRPIETVPTRGLL